MKSIILFRHGQAGWGNSIYGKDYDKPLTPIGEEGDASPDSIATVTTL